MKLFKAVVGMNGFVSCGIVIVLAWIAFANTAALAVDYYVDPAGTDDGSHGAGPGTDAWKTIEYAVVNVADPATAGIVIHVSGDTYTLNSNRIDIQRGFADLTIRGAGAGSTIVQAAASAGVATAPVYYIYSGETVALEDMTIRHGVGNRVGGGIHNLGSLSLANCTVSDNNVKLNAYGGGIWTRGPLTMTNCTVSGNSCLYNGGGIYATEDLVLANCTITGNNAYGSTSSGGGLYVKQVFSGFDAVLTNCTFTGNSAANLGGGIFLGGSSTALSIQNTIIGGNSSKSGANDFFNSGGTVTDNGYNIVEDSYGYTFSAPGDITGDMTGRLHLGELADNGGPTQTCALLEGSVAIGRGTDTNAAGPST